MSAGSCLSGQDTPDTYFPCQYHLETLANTQCWRTEEKIARLAKAIDHHNYITKGFGGFAVKLNGKQVGPGWAYMQPFFPLSFPQKAPNHRKTLTALARVCGDKPQVVRESVETLNEMLSEDGILRTTFASSYEKSRFKDNFRSGHPYAKVGDNEIPDDKGEMLYENPATLNDTWGYKSFDNNWKNPDEVRRIREHLNSRGINYLLNVGPDYLGRIPAPAVDILRKAR